MSVKSTIEGIFKKDFKEIQGKSKAEASAALLKLKGKVQKLELFSRIYTGKVERVGSGRAGAGLRQIQRETGSAELDAILKGNDLKQIQDLAGKILNGEAPAAVGDRIRTIGLEQSLQRTIDLFNQGAAALERLIANPADADARAALADADTKLQLLLHPDMVQAIQQAAVQTPPKPGILTRLSGSASSLVTNVSERLKTLQMRRIARDYVVPVTLAAASHMTDHPEMFATYAGLTLLGNLISSCRRQPQRPLPGKQNPPPAAVTTNRPTQLAAPSVLPEQQQSGQPSAAPSPAPSDEAGDQIDDAQQDKPETRTPSNTPEPELEAALAHQPQREPTPPAVSAQLNALAPQRDVLPQREPTPPASEQPAAALVKEEAVAAVHSDEQRQEPVLQHHIKPKAPKKKHKPSIPTFVAAPPKELPKPAAQRTPSPSDAHPLSPVPSTPVTFSGSAFQPPGQLKKPAAKMGAVGFQLPSAHEAASLALAKQKASSSQTLPLLPAKPKPQASSAHMSALQPYKPLPPYSIVAGTANQNDVPHGKLACTFVSGYMVKLMLEKDQTKQGSVLEQVDLDTALISGADAYRSTMERHSKQWEEDLGAAYAEVQLDRPAGFGWSECLTDPELSAALATTAQYTVKGVPIPAVNELDGNIQPLSPAAFQAIFKPMHDLADAKPGKLIVAAVTFGTGVGIAETFPVAIRKVGNEYEYQFGNSHGTDAFGEGKIQLNRFIPRPNALSATHRTHFQRYAAQRLAVVSRGEPAVEVTVAITDLKPKV